MSVNTLVQFGNQSKTPDVVALPADSILKQHQIDRMDTSKIPDVIYLTKNNARPELTETNRPKPSLY